MKSARKIGPTLSVISRLVVPTDFLLKSYCRVENLAGVIVEEDFKCWKANGEADCAIKVLQGKTLVSEAAESFYLSPFEIENRVDEGKRELENALRAKPLDIRSNI